MTTPAIQHNQEQTPAISQRLPGILMMVVVTFMWASMPVMIKEIINTVSPSVQIAVRFTLGAVIFLPFARNLNLTLIRDGIITGLLFFGGVFSETIALKTIPANQASFIYGLIVIFVTLFEVIFYRRQSSLAIVSTVITFIGIGIISWQNGPPPVGDVWMLLCALLASAWIILLEILASNHPILPLTFVQLSSVAILGLLWASPELVGNFDLVSQSVMNGNNLPILIYLGVMATGLNTWLQTTAVTMITAFEAGIIETLEPVFGAVLAFFLLGETFQTRGYIGAAIVILGMVMALSARNHQDTTELTLPVNEKKELSLSASNKLELNLPTSDNTQSVLLQREQQIPDIRTD